MKVIPIIKFLILICGTFILIFLAVVGIFMLGADFGRFSLKKELNTLTQTPKKTPTPTPTNDYTSYKSRVIYTNSGNYFVYGETIKLGGKWRVRIVVDGQNSDVGKVDRIIYEKITDLNDEQIIDKYNTADFQAAWDNEDNKLATIWKNVRLIWEVKDKVDNAKEFSMPEKYRGVAFFVGQRLLVVADDGLYQVWPEFSLEMKRNSYEYGFSPLPGNVGYIYWHEVNMYEKFNLVMVINGIKKEYPLRDWANDYPGKIEVSPGLNYVCLEGGTSGYFGYGIVRIADGKTILGGQQYSYCDRWLDNTHVLVHEVPYFNQWTTQYYSVNMNGIKKLVSYFETGK